MKGERGREKENNPNRRDRENAIDISRGPSRPKSKIKFILIL